MSFLQPLGLLLAGLAAVPLLLHLLRREVVQRVSFPALRYLRSAERRTARSMRLRDLLLLAARVGLLILLAVAAARPLAGRGDADDHAPTDAVLLIDNSASMGRVREGRTLLDWQLDAVKGTLGEATPSDRFWVVPAAGPPLAAGVDAATARAVLDSLPATDAAADLVDQAAAATAAVPVEDGRFRELQIYTDGQASGLRGGPLDLSGWGRVVASVPDDASSTNGYVADLRLEPDGLVVPGDPPAAAVALARDTDQEADDATDADTIEVRLVLDGRTVAVARDAPGSEILIALPDLAPGPHALRAETPAAGLRADDVRHLGLVAAEAPTVRRPAAGDGFLDAALSTLAGNGRIRPAGDDPLVVLEGSATPVPAGTGPLLLVPPAEMPRLPAFQQRLDALGIPWRLEGRFGAGDLRLAGGDLPGLEEIRVGLSHSLTRLAAPVTEDDSVLLRTTDGAPWLVRGRSADRVYLLLASPLRPDATSLPVSAAMVPFVERLVLHWSRPASSPLRSMDAGTTVTLPSRLERLRRPDGQELRAEGGAPWTPLRSGTWTLVLPDEAGGDRHVGVNVPASESDLRPASKDRVHRAFGTSEVDIIDPVSGWPGAVFGARRGAEATPWVVGLILALAVIELLLAAPSHRGRRPDVPEPA